MQMKVLCFLFLDRFCKVTKLFEQIVKKRASIIYEV